MIHGKTYDRLKFLAQILLPAFATFYLTLGQLWGLPETENVVGTIVAIDTFLGVILQLSSNKYNNTFDGALQLGEVIDEEGTRNVALSLPVSAEHVEEKKVIRLKVIDHKD